MIKPLKKEQGLTEGQVELLYWGELKFNSHKWVEFANGYYTCAFCNKTHTSVTPIGMYDLCDKNPHLNQIVE